MTPRYVAMAGPLGVGKSTLANPLSDALNAHLIREAFSSNPFLERLYEPGGPARWGLPCEVSFLGARVNQMAQIETTLARGRSVLTDWFPYQHLVYAQVTLSDEDYHAYATLFERTFARFPAPNLVVYLDAPPEVLRQRIHSRGRALEGNVEQSYLERIRKAFLDWWGNHPLYNVVSVDTQHLRLDRRSPERGRLLAHIRSQLPSTPREASDHSGPRTADFLDTGIVTRCGGEHDV